VRGRSTVNQQLIVIRRIIPIRTNRSKLTHQIVLSRLAEEDATLSIYGGAYQLLGSRMAISFRTSNRDRIGYGGRLVWTKNLRSNTGDRLLKEAEAHGLPYILAFAAIDLSKQRLDIYRIPFDVADRLPKFGHVGIFEDDDGKHIAGTSRANSFPSLLDIDFRKYCKTYRLSDEEARSLEQAQREDDERTDDSAASHSRHLVAVPNGSE
jgi:hypothetical protein